ncbi:MAG: glycosyltransferase family 4 protein [Nocardioides sp.]|uniref:glycosyltransferase family 4 protein n=1 Tax=Nocardioides sp. TaxID=35761 RepID=UPI0032650AE6
MKDVHFVVPAGIDDPRHPSGGNVYDRRLSQELVRLGWVVHEHLISTAGLTRALADIPDGCVVLVDGLIADDSLVAETSRLRIVVLLHMPVGDDRELAILNAAAAVVTTSEWARDRVPAVRASVATPGSDLAPLAPGSSSGVELLCVAAVVRAKGQDVLLDALARITHLDWRCTIVGALDLDPDFVAELRETERVHFTGPLTGSALDAVFGVSDLLVSSSRRESYGMAVTEALARGIPVVTTDVGGLPEAVGAAPDGSRPGLLFPSDDAGALADRLERWLTDGELRVRLRQAAACRRTTVGTWTQTAVRVAEVLARW